MKDKLYVIYQNTSDVLVYSNVGSVIGSVTFNDGTTYNMRQTATAAMNQWNNLTEAYFLTSNPGIRSRIEAYGEKYGDN